MIRLPSRFFRRLSWRLLSRFSIAGLSIALGACLERPDPASQAAAILNKRPSGFLDKLTALDALAASEAETAQASTEAGAAMPGGDRNRPTLAESLYAYSTRLRPALEAAPTDSAKVEALNTFLFDSLGIVPLLDDSTLAASIPSRVLANRRGGCVGLVLLYLALGQSLDLPLFPVFLPGHVIIRHRSGSLVRNVETLRRGLARTDSFYRESFSLGKRPWYSLADARPEQALGALVFNLGNFHRSRGNRAASQWEYRLAEESLPGFPEALGNLGAGFLAAGDLDQAGEKLAASLAGDSIADPAWRNLEILHRSKGDIAGENNARSRRFSMQ